MPDRYDFANLSPIEFEGFCVDLVSAETGLRFERFSEGADGGVDGRHSQARGDIILQAKHYKQSTWSDLQKTVRSEKAKVAALNPSEYYLLTSQALTSARKDKLVQLLGHPSVIAANIWGRTELNAYLAKHGEVEKRNIKLWLSSAAVLDRLLKNDIAIFTEATYDEIERILKVFVVNPSLSKSAEILKAAHCLIVSGPPGVGKTTLAQVLAAEYSESGWELVSISSIEDGFRAFQSEHRQVFVFDDFLGKIRLDHAALARDDSKIVRFMSMVRKDKGKRFVLTTRSYILQAAKTLSEALDDTVVDVAEIVLNLSTYTRELKARILYNHLYHSDIDQAAIQALLAGDVVRQIVDHRNYMPRIIQWMTDEIRQRGVAPLDYPQVFLHTLENPDKIWDKAFRQHISPKARILLYCMYFAGQEGWPKPGVRLDQLRVFFDRSIVEFGEITKQALRVSMFEESLREVKSSFVVVDNGRANFINPSVQDYLSRETADDTILSTLARCVPTVATATSLWKKMGKDLSAATRTKVADGVLTSLLGGQVEGRLPLHELANLVGDLVLATGDFGTYCARLRRLESNEHFWTNEVNLPALIDALSHGRFSHLPHARAYARYLRLQIYKFVSPDREYAMELEELATLASHLGSSKLEMPEQFFNHFDQAVAESVDILDVDKIRSDEDPEQVIGEWLEHIQTIETHTSTSVGYFKKRQFEERIDAIQRHRDMERQEEHYQPTLRSEPLARNSTSSGGFSNSDLQSMFSSLKKSE
ncbi:ATP-binding protein [Bradyrhizobium yuanmingense]|uniref:ATP-binding protein n=1 Tax=Bradyrhizobium yuanmingense TaxID=108015 RepID=UPI000A896627|nr:ATP-binding protein [Bradyrhizobium yuanmingense]